MSPRLALRLVVLALGGLCAVGLWRVFAGLGYQVPLDPNEGWNAYHAAAAMRGEALYPPSSAYLVNNYPPLSFYVVGVLGRLIGDFIIAGRIVSLAALGFLMVALTAIARQLGVLREAALFAGLTFLAELLLYSDYAGMDDPQMLAHAVAIGGLWLLLAKPRTTKTVALAAALFTASIFVKHNIVALPVATFLWLAVEDRKAAWRFAGFGLGFLLLGLIAFRLAYGISLFSVIATARLYSIDQLSTMATVWLAARIVPLLGLAFLAYRYAKRPAALFCVGYALVATALGMVFLGGAGVDANALFEADIALGLCAALVISYLPGYRSALAAALYVVPLLVFAVSNSEWQQAYLTLHPLRAEAAVAQGDIAFMKARKGPALCEMLSFCYWAAKPPTVDFFNVGQQFDTGARSDAALTAAIDAKRFAVIQFDPDSDYSLGENPHNAMARAYRIHHSDWYGTFYVPK